MIFTVRPSISKVLGSLQWASSMIISTVCRLGQRHQLRRERVHSPFPALLRRQVKNWISSIIRKRQHLGKKAGILRRRCIPRQHRAELVEFVRWRVFPGEAGSTFDATNDRVKRAIDVLRRTEIAQPRLGFAR